MERRGFSITEKIAKAVFKVFTGFPDEVIDRVVREKVDQQLVEAATKWNDGLIDTIPRETKIE